MSEIKFLTREIGSLGKPSWRVKSFAGRPLEESDFAEAERWGEKPTTEEVKQAARVIRKRERELRMITSRAFGMRLLLEAAWRELGIGKALADFAAERRIEFDFERVVFAMVLNRMCDPKSKHACNTWAKERAYLPEAKDWDVQHYYRALDVLHDHWEALEKALEKFGKNFPGGLPGGFPDNLPGLRPGLRPESRLGARLAAPSDVLVEQLNLPKDQGLVVEQVQAGSAAAKAGLKANDILLELAGKAVPNNPREFTKQLQDIKANTPVDAVVLRKGKKTYHLVAFE